MQNVRVLVGSEFGFLSERILFWETLCLHCCQKFFQREFQIPQMEVCVQHSKALINLGWVKQPPLNWLLWNGNFFLFLMLVMTMLMLMMTIYDDDRWLHWHNYIPNQSGFGHWIKCISTTHPPIDKNFEAVFASGLPIAEVVKPRLRNHLYHVWMSTILWQLGKGAQKQGNKNAPPRWLVK